MILDVTAGNRMIWGKKKNPAGVIFIDKESGFRIPQDIMADNTNLPIRTDLKIDSIIFDPPWMVNPPAWWLDKDRENGTRGDYFGSYDSKKQIVPYLNKAFNEFKNYTERVCMKWGDSDIPLYRILGFIKRNGWTVINKREVRAKKNSGGKSKTLNWWVTFIRKRERS